MNNAKTHHFKIQGSISRLFSWVILMLLFVGFDVLLILALINNWSDEIYILLVLIIPLTILILPATIRVIRLLVFTLKKRPLLIIKENQLIENFDHRLKISIADIKKLEIKPSIGVLRPPVELIIKTNNRQINSPYQSNQYNLTSFRCRNNEILIDPIFYRGSRKEKINTLCEFLKTHNPAIRIIKPD